MRARVSTLTLALSLAVGMAGCGTGQADPDRTLTVYAASSLQPTFERLAQRFEADHPGVEVAFSFAGSSDLVAQVQQGAPADVVATADTRTMADLAEDHLLAGPAREFATNRLQIAVPPDNPAGVESLDDLAADDLDLVLCAPEVPCGAAAVEVEERTGVALQPVSEERNVTDVLNKVATGEADAGLVYVTDVRAAGDRVVGLPLPASARATNVYPIGTVAGTDQGVLAREFVDLVLGADGRRVLAAAGFGRP